MTIKEIRAQLKEAGIPFSSRMRKPELEALLPSEPVEEPKTELQLLKDELAELQYQGEAGTMHYRHDLEVRIEEMERVE